MQGRGGEELSSELSVALQRCLLGGKSGAGKRAKKQDQSIKGSNLLKYFVLFD